MTTIRRLLADEWQASRAIRLAALKNSPDAFGSTHAAEAAMDDAFWRQRAGRGASSATAATFVADDNGFVGLASVSLDDSRDAMITSMFVAPGYRRQGLGLGLLETAIAAARSMGARRIALWVADGNPADALYQRLGFVATGTTEPLRDGSAIMIRELALPPAGAV